MSVADNASIYQPLRWAYGLVPVVAGLDKFLNLLADWESYLSPAVASLLPVSPGTFMAVVGVIEIAAGVVVLTRWTRLGAYLVMGWLVLIAVNLLFAGHYDVAVRDLVMAVGAYTLARLSEVRAGVAVRSPARAAA